LAWFDNERHYFSFANSFTSTAKHSKSYTYLLVRVSVNILSSPRIFRFFTANLGDRVKEREREDMANALICLPPEIVHNILKYVNPIDLARIAETCRMLHRSIAQDRLLCKEVWCLCLVSSNRFRLHWFLGKGAGTILKSKVGPGLIVTG
jgi:hypothetical protein